ncbi:MAG: DUF5678 domain-containing protein [Candidatus Aenigmatarchaeota archaeon]
MKDKDFKWIGKHYDDLVKNYNNKWIAVLNEKVIESDKSLTSLKKRIKDKGCVFEFITDKKFPSWDKG